MSIFKDKHGNKLTLNQAFRKGIVRFYNYLLDFELMVLRWVGHVPFHLFRKYCYRLSGMKIGRGSTIHIHADFYNPAKIKIGKDTIVGRGVFLDGREQITIGDHVDIASEVMVYNSQHDINDDYFVAINAPVEMGDYVFIGPRVIILPGVKIGKGAVVGAGAVVTKDVPEFAVVGGVPAKVIGERKNKDLHYVLGRPRLFQ